MCWCLREAIVTKRMYNFKPLILLFNPQCAKPNYQRLPAAILQIASFIEGHYSYEIVDGNLNQGQDYAQLIIQKIRQQNIKYLAVSVMPGPQLNSAVRDIRLIKCACPDLVIIIGGYFPLNHADVCAQDDDIDYVIVGPGEITFKALIDALENNADPALIEGLAFFSNDSLIKTGQGTPIIPDDLPRYPYHKLTVGDYVVPTFLGSRTLSHHSSYGCPFKCNFCAVVSHADGKWMGESGERLGELVEYMVGEWQLNAFEFHDNNFFTSEKRVNSFSKELIRRGLKLRWWGEGRADTLLKYSDETWELMRQSGLTMVFMGAESGDDETLKRMNKGGTQSTSGILALAAKMKQFNIIPEFSFIIGNPPDPIKDMKKSIRFIQKIKKINPNAEIIMYRYDPVPIGGEMFESVTKLGFTFPTTLDEWTNDKWRKIQSRTTADVPWLTARGQQHLADFQTVLNAYYPTSTARHIPKGSWRYLLLRIVSGVRYHLGFYNKPVELNWLQKKFAYQRPEISGF